MSLATDSIFVTALKANAELMGLVSNRLYSTTIAMPDKDLNNAPIPYIIVMFEGLNNDVTTKDDEMESDTDVVNVSVEVATKSRKALSELTKEVRQTIYNYLRREDTAIEDYQFSAERVNYDQTKPCYWQVLNYRCDVINGINDEQD